MRRPWMRAAMRSGSPPRSTRVARNSAETMERPTSGAIERVTVSTSGSSGTLGHLDQNVVALHLHCVGGDAPGGIVVVFARDAIELPQVVRANHAAVVNLALAQRATAMQANPAQCTDSPTHVANGVGSFPHHAFHHRAGRQARHLPHMRQRHLLQYAARTPAARPPALRVHYFFRIRTLPLYERKLASVPPPLIVP